MKRENKIINRGLLIKVVIPCSLVIILILILTGEIKGLNDDYSVLNIELLHLISIVVISFVGIYVYVNKNTEEELNHLELNMNIINESNYLKIRTEAYNPTIYDRHIKFSFIVINKFGESYLDKLNKEMEFHLESPEDLIKLEKSNQILKREFAFIPLPYYNEENFHVGNEKLIYEVPIFFDNNRIDDPTFFEVRFFVFRKSDDLNPLHRIVSCSFGINGNLNLDHLHRQIYNRKKDINTGGKLSSFSQKI
jgi:hypothetical protein